VAIVGAGIVGLATALTLSERFARLSIVVIDKEARVASHQTGHNSGVLHAGIYYKPGSYKARLCVDGVRKMEAFCERNGVPFDRCGKVIVATGASQISRLEALFERGAANGVPGLEMIGPERLREIEPHARAVRAIHSPRTAIVDFSQVAQAMARVFSFNGGQIRTGERVESVVRRDGLLRMETSGGTVSARTLINCSGLHTDRVARMMGVRNDIRIIPFRGEYFNLRPQRGLVRGLIYPVPDPAFPFLGVHFTKRIDGSYEAGPNAVLALAREGYRKTDIHPGELLRMLAFSGFWRMAARHWRTGLYEYYRSFSRRVFLRDLQKLVPDLRAEDLFRGGSGVRAQAVNRDGLLVEDFAVEEVPNAIHLLNAPSPAATASLAIAEHLVQIAARNFSLL